MNAHHIPRILAIACFTIALITAADPTTVLGVGWFVWTSAGLLAWALEPVLRV